MFENRFHRLKKWLAGLLAEPARQEEDARTIAMNPFCQMRKSGQYPRLLDGLALQEHVNHLLFTP